MKKLLFSALALCLVLGACNQPQSGSAQYVPAENFKDQMDTVQVGLYTLNNGVIAAQVTNYGARVVSLYAPDRNGKVDNVLVGHNQLKDYVMNRGERTLGAVAGPVAGPISGASFRLDGRAYQTERNAGEHTFDGGSLGTDKRPWTVTRQTDSTLEMKLVLQDGDGGFPGKRVLTVTYALSKNDFLVLLRGFSNARTPLSLSWRPWFNLHGEGEGTIEDQQLSILAAAFQSAGEDGIPGRERVEAKGSPFDFVEFRALGDGMKELQRDYNHNWCLTYDKHLPLHMACLLQDPVSGRQLSVLTNRPCLQVSTAGAFEGVTGANGKPIGRHGGVLLAAQDFPNAVNELTFPQIIVDPEGYFSSITVYKFGFME